MISNDDSLVSILGPETIHTDKPSKTVVHIPVRPEGSGGYQGNIFSVADVTSFFTLLKTEISDYLLFLKSVASIELRVVNDGCFIRVEIPPEAREYRLATSLQVPLEAHSFGIGEGYDLCHETSIILTDAENNRSTYGWLISQHIRNCHTNILLEGDARQTVVCWSAVAALLSVDIDEPVRKTTLRTFNGRLFDPLPSSLSTNLPVHIFGAFSSNRGSALQRLDSNSGSKPADYSPQLRDNKLLPIVVGCAWAYLLRRLSLKYPSAEAVDLEILFYRYWPVHTGIPLLEYIYDYTLYRILSQEFSVWPTANGLLPIQKVFISRMMSCVLTQMVRKRHHQLRDRLHAGLSQLKMPVLYVPGEYTFLLRVHI